MPFSPAAAIKISADTIQQLRRADVYRVLDSVAGDANNLLATAKYINDHRPDLANEVSDVVAEIGREGAENAANRATICEFGTAPEQKADGFVGVGTVRGTDEVAEHFSREVRLVRGGEFHDSPGVYEFYVMIRETKAADVPQIHQANHKTKPAERIGELEAIISSIRLENGWTKTNETTTLEGGDDVLHLSTDGTGGATLILGTPCGDGVMNSMEMWSGPESSLRTLCDKLFKASYSDDESAFETLVKQSNRYKQQ